MAKSFWIMLSARREREMAPALQLGEQFFQHRQQIWRGGDEVGVSESLF
jgi:hypothetical protein